MIKREHGILWRCWKRILWILTFEFLLRSRANGSSVIFARAVGFTCSSAIILLFLDDLTNPCRSLAWCVDWGHATAWLRAHASTLGAIFAAAYAALHSRFSSQWNYLAGVYNQLMQSSISNIDKYNHRQFNAWRAGFVEDAFRLHLAAKDMYREAIADLLTRPNVRSRVLESLGPVEFKHLCELTGVQIEPAELFWKSSN